MDVCDMQLLGLRTCREFPVVVSPLGRWGPSRAGVHEGRAAPVEVPARSSEMLKLSTL